MDYWNIDLGLSEHSAEYKALFDFMNSYVGHMHHYLAAKFTSNTESFHHLANKYCAKGINRSFVTYVARKTLAVLDWNENYKCQLHTYNFRTKIMKKFIDSLV